MSTDIEWCSIKHPNGLFYSRPASWKTVADGLGLPLTRLLGWMDGKALPTDGMNSAVIAIFGEDKFKELQAVAVEGSPYNQLAHDLFKHFKVTIDYPNKSGDK